VIERVVRSVKPKENNNGEQPQASQQNPGQALLHNRILSLWPFAGNEEAFRHPWERWRLDGELEEWSVGEMRLCALHHSSTPLLPCCTGIELAGETPTLPGTIGLHLVIFSEKRYSRLDGVDTALLEMWCGA
jgi:hypothetical protein